MKRNRTRIREGINSLSAKEYQELIASEELPKPKKNINKYFNQKIKYNGMNFDSKRELSRYKSLEILAKEGIITNLQRQVKYKLIPSKKPLRAVTYKADFVYIKDNKQIVEDSKHPYIRKNDHAFRIKKKLMYQIYNILIEEV